MLLAGWDACIVKNCNRGLENADQSIPRSQFLTIILWTDSTPVNNMFIFSPGVNWFTSGFVYATLLLNRHVVYKPFVKTLISE